MLRFVRRDVRPREERGAIAVEAALVLPILLIMLLGIVEVSLLIRDNIAITSATRQGARVASSAPGAGPAICETGPLAPPCGPTSTPALAQAAADAIQRAGSSMPKDSIDFILIYKANAAGYPGSVTGPEMPSTCPADCVKFVWRDDQNAFKYNSGAWSSKSINACINESDTLGIYMHATHDFVTSIFGSSTGLEDRAVMKFEPLSSDTCKSTSVAPHP